MIKVLEHGVMKVTCPNCKAKLQYEQEDVITEKRIDGNSWIICPDCGSKIFLTGSSKKRNKDEIDALLNEGLPY